MNQHDVDVDVSTSGSSSSHFAGGSGAGFAGKSGNLRLAKLSEATLQTGGVFLVAGAWSLCSRSLAEG